MMLSDKLFRPSVSPYWQVIYLLSDPGGNKC
ncbi:hypothetical protein EHW99_2522 [Erwinia amylovora]|uniref:Uncharacterized protein n=3 Tax=Erwinia amylovora TaxID=552 RepID=A0A830ZXP2_ERWAM|nr:hypothetical protein EaACW_1068 [Erwinia amylovora ACW56400]QJQ55224.1 hypothetical protein EHX00_2522 [Erwinia amylovora]CBA20008.1 hypothetical protein predicted by Glimmer/Critica [Erwinia amylovora CFBP1430]CBX79909.1 hypothetical protein predicted by Glimmer/Critica [Erwinia amylovora ATCC BAA-2158]CCO77911.1 hypothetical protein BN432_1090 [Erwinia amylovora Ea356]CCO81698.1 hypothetical protein BN433_1104 [Erwinia amylovora Ea266]CCO85502.1 hypothetical protein BN434_1091 [Erwinia a